MRRAALTACAMALALGACAAPATIPSSPTAGPGKALMTPYDAGVIFADTCLIRGARFEDALEGLRVHNMTRNQGTGTYYHNRRNLSVRITDQQCSLVFGTDMPLDDAVAGLAQGSASLAPNPPAGISVTSRPGPDGLSYFRLGIEAPVAPGEGG